jgi:subtilisin-like proprotein convertase family protein
MRPLVKLALFAAISMSMAAATVAPARAAVSNFFNFSGITIPSSGAGVPFPSGIAVAGVAGVVTHVTVTLFGVTHTFSDDIDVILQSPSGQGVMLMSDAGGGGNLNNVNLAFDDCATRVVPNSAQISAGRFRPSNYGADTIIAPAPDDAATTLAVFNGVSPNGTWNLFVSDDAGGDLGSIAGWGLTIFTAPSLPAGNPVACDKPDFDGDGRADVSVFRDGVWFIQRSSDGGTSAISWGTAGDIPVWGDYDGDGITDAAVYRNGNWFARRSSDGGLTYVGFGGAAQDIPVPADYDGDGITDVAVYRAGVWFIRQSSDGGTTVTSFGGAAQDVPLP